MNCEIIIHVGLPRAGSTFIQKRIFKKLDSNKFNIAGTHFGGFNFNTYVDKNKVNIFTKESLSTLRRSNNGECRYEIANRLKRLYPDAKILYVYRDTDEFIKSLYNLTVQEGYIYPYENFCYTIAKFNNKFCNLLYYSHLCDLFDNVHICMFKDLKKNPKLFVKDILDFIGIDITNDIDYSRINASWNDKTIKNALYANRYFKSIWNKNALLPRKLNPYAIKYGFYKRGFK